MHGIDFDKSEIASSAIPELGLKHVCVYIYVHGIVFGTYNNMGTLTGLSGFVWEGSQNVH